MTASHPDHLDRLIAGVLLPGFEGTTPPPWLAVALGGGLAGVCLFAHNLAGPEQVRALTSELHRLRSDALVASDEEGGGVTRLEAATGSSWPSAAALGRYDDPDATRAVAVGLGRGATDAGVDLVAAPVADVHSDPDNPIIGLRSFGPDPARVAAHVTAFVKGVQSAGTAACAKHFPGHGDTHLDSHLDLPRIDVDKATLRARDLPPFAAAVQAEVAAVMTGHLVVPSFDSAPATLSPRLLGMLRDELGFEGVIVSDALDMAAVSQSFGQLRGAVAALAAGVDLLCLGNPSYPQLYDAACQYDAIRAALRAAVRDGELREERLAEAVGRVAALGGSMAGRRATVAAAEHNTAARAASRRVAAGVLELGGQVALSSPPLVVDLRGDPSIAAGRRVSGVVTALTDRGARVHTGPPGAIPFDRGAVVAVVAAPHRHDEVQGALAHLLATRANTVVVDTGLPDNRSELGDNWVRSWGDSRVQGEVVAERLLDR